MKHAVRPEALHRRLLAWFAAHKRDLPWRRTRDPYAILVSEFMLQQTRVAVVEARWSEFLARFPTASALADAPLDDVLAVWSGLGYYRRARNLHAAAGIVRDRFAGRLPPDARSLRELPGVGAYTAAAVTSIAFGLPEPLVDGNVARVLSRLFRLRGAPRAPRNARRLLALAGTLVPHDGRAGDWNQALMELGATVCLPRGPRCADCPILAGCAAHAAGRPDAYPSPTRAASSVKEVHVSVALERNGRWLLCRNGPGEKPAGMFEFPRVPWPERAAHGARRTAVPLAMVREAIRKALGVRVDELRRLGSFRHQILNRSIAVTAFAGRISGPAHGRRGGRASWCWLAADEWRRVPLSAAALRMIELLVRAGPPRAASRERAGRRP
jgi:A/G-specific adenine glycosylase